MLDAEFLRRTVKAAGVGVRQETRSQNICSGFRLLGIPLQDVSCGFLKTESPQFFLAICKTCDLNKPVVVMHAYNPNAHTQEADRGRS